MDRLHRNVAATARILVKRFAIAKAEGSENRFVQFECYLLTFASATRHNTASLISAQQAYRAFFHVISRKGTGNEMQLWAAPLLVEAI